MKMPLFAAAFYRQLPHSTASARILTTPLKSYRPSPASYHQHSKAQEVTTRILLPPPSPAFYRHRPHPTAQQVTARILPPPLAFYRHRPHPTAQFIPPASYRPASYRRHPTATTRIPPPPLEPYRHHPHPTTQKITNRIISTQRPFFKNPFLPNLTRNNEKNCLGGKIWAVGCRFDRPVGCSLPFFKQS